MAKIIIIDDEPAMVEVIVTLCREKGHQVFPFSSAAKAVEQMASIAVSTEAKAVMRMTSVCR